MKNTHEILLRHHENRINADSNDVSNNTKLMNKNKSIDHQYAINIDGYVVVVVPILVIHKLQLLKRFLWLRLLITSLFLQILLLLRFLSNIT